MQAADCGADGFAPAPGRALLAVGLAADAVAGFQNRADRLGYIVRPDDPRRAVSACAGAPACASGMMPARAIAAGVAAAATPMLDGSVSIHVSGCAKGCAHPRPATLSFIGNGDRADVVVGGRAGDPARRAVAPAAILASLRGLADAVADARRPGERAGDTILRLGPEAVAASREAVDA